MCDERIALVNHLRIRFEELKDPAILVIVVPVFKQMAKAFKCSTQDQSELIHEKLHGRFIMHALDLYSVSMTSSLGSV